MKVLRQKCDNCSSQRLIIFCVGLFCLVNVYSGQQAKAAQMVSTTIPASITKSTPAIQSNQSKLDNTNEVLNSWNRAYLVFGALAVFFTFSTVVCSFFIYKNSKKAGDLQSEILDEKDRALSEYQADAAVKIADADSKAKQAGERAAEAALQVSEANTKIAELNAANLQLEAQIAPRRITQYGKPEYLLLKSLAPKTVSLSSYALDADGTVLSAQMFNVLTNLGFTIQDNRMSQGPGSNLLFAVWISGQNSKLVDALILFFQSAGIATQRGQPQFNMSIGFNVRQYSTAPDASIFVGLKPMPDMISAP